MRIVIIEKKANAKSKMCNKLQKLTKIIICKEHLSLKLRLRWLFQAAAVQFTLHCKLARNFTVWHVEFFMQALCNAKKNCKENYKCLQQNKFKLILLQALAILSRNFFFSLKIELSFYFQIFIAHPFLRGYTTTTFWRLQCNNCIAPA